VRPENGFFVLWKGSQQTKRAFSAFRETFEKCSISFKFKEDENFNHPSTICRTYGAGRNTWSILRIALKLHFVQNVESDTEIGRKGAFCKSLTESTLHEARRFRVDFYLQSAQILFSHHLRLHP
jgi:hypothetical protein